MGKNIYPYPYGFTLIELVVVIVVVGILSALGGLIITNHMEGYVDVSNRAKLVDSAQSALLRMERDIRAALPNSIETWTNGNYEGITFLHTVAGGRYRTKCSSDSSCTNNQTLEFNQEDNRFSMIGRLRENNVVPSSGRAKVVIYNTGQDPASAYSSGNTAGIQSFAYDNTGVSNSTNFIINNKEFPYRSPYKRFQIIDTQVRYIWNESKKTLTRYQRNATAITDPRSGASDDWGTGSLIARHVEDVNFDYAPGTATRSGLLTMNATLLKEGETITLLHQVHVLNTP